MSTTEKPTVKRITVHSKSTGELLARFHAISQGVEFIDAQDGDRSDYVLGTTEFQREFTVVDTRLEGEDSILGWFSTEQEAAEFCGLLPDALDGHYSIDGWPR